MVDLNTCPPTPPQREHSKIKSFMGRTPGIGILKSKFLTVLENSNDLLNGISNKLALSNSSSDSEYLDDYDENLPKFDETIDYTKIDFEFRRVKARRAHEEVISGCFRHPNLAPKPLLDPSEIIKPKSPSSSSSSSSSSSRSLHSNNAVAASQLSSTTRSNSLESRHSGGYGRPGRAIPGARRSELDIQKDLSRISESLDLRVECNQKQQPYLQQQQQQHLQQQQQHLQQQQQQQQIQQLPNDGHLTVETAASTLLVPARRRPSNSSTITSLRDDPHQISPSVESMQSDWRHFIRSESQNSVPSWASSISLDCRASEEPVKEFMKTFTEILFNGPSAIGIERKVDFGGMVRLDIGRKWFIRFLLEQKKKSKCVDEITFHSLVQYFAILLFECNECEDFGPAVTVMNYCFLFYHEIEVPGCDPYREYLFTFMRQQPIWHSLRFWNAAFFEVLNNTQCKRNSLKNAESKTEDLQQKVTANVIERNEDDAASSSSSSYHKDAIVGSRASGSNDGKEKRVRIKKHIIFRHLGAFTCNMHALGIPQELCLEFLKRQTISLNLPKDEAKLIRDNILRMYHETDQWGAKES